MRVRSDVEYSNCNYLAGLKEQKLVDLLWVLSTNKKGKTMQMITKMK